MKTSIGGIASPRLRASAIRSQRPRVFGEGRKERSNSPWRRSTVPTIASSGITCSPVDARLVAPSAATTSSKGSMCETSSASKRIRDASRDRARRRRSLSKAIFASSRGWPVLTVSVSTAGRYTPSSTVSSGTSAQTSTRPRATTSRPKRDVAADDEAPALPQRRRAVREARLEVVDALEVGGVERDVRRLGHALDAAVAAQAVDVRAQRQQVVGGLDGDEARARHAQRPRTLEDPDRRAHRGLGLDHLGRRGVAAGRRSCG